MEEISGYDLTLCLQKLSKADFMSFKVLLRKAPEEFELDPIPWTEIKMASRKGLVMLLNKNYPGKVWDIALSLFQKVKRKDLFAMTEALRRDKGTPYKETMKTLFNFIWNFESGIYVPYHEFEIITEMQYSSLQVVFEPQSQPVTAVILGNKGEGKTTFLRRAMLDWASGDLWQNRFQYVFFFSLMSLNDITELSLAQLLLSKLSESSESLEDILSDPRRILFILEGFDYLKFDLELRTNLCNDWRKTVPTQIVLSSLLQKVMLPESSLLLELGNLSVPKIYPLLQKPRDITLGGYTDEAIKYYCMSFMYSYTEGSAIFNYLQTMQPLLTLCKNPYKRWMVCSTLKCQRKRGENMNIDYKPDSALYASFMVNSFRAEYANRPSRQNRDQLKPLCTLAVEGMWKLVFVFKPEDLYRNGISESGQIVWLKMNFLNTRGDHFVFYHPALQLYFAALFYFLRQDEDRPHPVIGSLSQLLREIYAHDQNQWLLTGIFVFGIATEKVAAILEPHFGSIPSEEMRQEILKCFRNLSRGECGEKLRSPQSLFDSLVDNQEEGFIRQVMDLFEEMTIDISSADALSVATTCLLKSQRLKNLHLHIQHRVFSEKYKPEDGDLEAFKHEKINAIKHWRMLCRVFQNLEVLDLDSCNFNETAISLLYLSMYPSHRGALNAFKLQSFSCSFVTNFGHGVLFHTLLQLPHLKSLNLYGTNLSNDVVENMCCVLKCSTCRVEELLLGKCNLSSEACGIIATSLIFCKVKHLSLVENPLKNKGVMLLCETLKRPSCDLETLMLSYCALTFIACGHLYEALLHNKYLSLLDLSSNFLEDTGVNILCKALKDPMCPLQELWLSGCYLTSDCCEEISAVLTHNQKLKTLKLGNNNIQDTGVRQLCEALSNPECKLRCLGLDMCEFTTGSCADLALVLTTCKTLTMLNLDRMTFDRDGLKLLCEALNHKDCNLKVLGLDKSAFCEESQKILQEVEKKNTLDILHYPWIKEESKKRGVRLVWNSEN
ncbi:NACHT, LRR and PYD domains-containing protein 9B isoform X2 [Cricetulus griseus]|uniref:NACHT, LRR and PYD domains-containing protein 9B isoform X2 n=1 Tax=Cricetulus griseus TaxID=10029 RepID=A0A9J7H6U7_CRIGR|nr:NACHT, LRR and PYD domains-containing protein 9B isoform X2 [Cricetulus griseus]